MNLLRQRNFGLLWLGGLISLVGDRALMIALPFFIYQQTNSTIATAAMYASAYLPGVLFGSVAGVFADRWSRKRLMIVTNLIQAVVILLLLLVQPTNWLWLAYVVFFIESLVATFFGPAESALLPMLVDEQDLVAANGLNALNNNIARLAGPPIGGLLLGWFGLSSVAIIDSLSFVIAAALIAGVVVTERTAAASPAHDDAPATSVWREWTEGLALIWRDRVIKILFAVTALTSFGGTMFDPLISPWIQSVLHGNALTNGLLATSGAIGGLIGGVLLTRFGRKLDPRQLFGWGCLVAGLVLTAMYSSTFVPVVLGLSVLKSVPLVGSGVGLDTLFQTRVPDSHRGRVYGAVGTTNAVIGLMSLATTGALAQQVGIVPMLMVGCGITALAGLVALVVLPRGKQGVAVESQPHPEPAVS